MVPANPFYDCLYEYIPLISFIPNIWNTVLLFLFRFRVVPNVLSSTTPVVQLLMFSLYYITLINHIYSSILFNSRSKHVSQQEISRWHNHTVPQ